MYCIDRVCCICCGIIALYLLWYYCVVIALCCVVLCCCVILCCVIALLSGVDLPW